MVPTNGVWPISLCCCRAVAPSGLSGIKAQESSEGLDALFTAEEQRGSESKRLAFLVINCKHFQGFTMQAQLTLGHRLIIQTLTTKRNSVAKENLNDLTFIQVRGRPSTYVRQGVRLNLRESLSWEVSRGQESMTRRAFWQLKKIKRFKVNRKWCFKSSFI